MGEVEIMNINVKKDKKIKQHIVIAVGLLLVVVFTVLCIKVNIKYKNPTTLVGAINDPIDSNGYELVVHSAGFVSDDQLQELWKDELSTFSDCKAYAVTISITKTDDNAKDFSLGDIMLVSGAFSNGVDLQRFYEMNADTLKPFKELKCNETVTYTFPFMIVKENFTDKQWNQFPNREFSVVFALYPQIKEVKL